MDHKKKGEGKNKGRKPVPQIQIYRRTAMMFNPPERLTKALGEGFRREGSGGTEYDDPDEEWTDRQHQSQRQNNKQFDHSEETVEVLGSQNGHDNARAFDGGRSIETENPIARADSAMSSRPSQSGQVSTSSFHPRSNANQLYPKHVSEIFRIAEEMTGCQPENLVLAAELGSRATTVKLDDLAHEIEQDCGADLRNIVMVPAGTYQSLSSDHEKMRKQAVRDANTIEIQAVQIRDLERRIRAHDCRQGVSNGR